MLHTISNSHLTVTVAEQGAELQSLRDAAGTEYLWQGDPKYWDQRAINLFPYVGRLVNKEYLWDRKRYTMELHGLALYHRFRLVENTGNKIVMELAANKELLAHYPRQFVFRVIYTLMENTLQITFEVENRDNKLMRFGLGGHPGFNIPFGGGSFEDYRLHFDAKCRPSRIIFSDTFHVAGEEEWPLEKEQDIPLTHELFNNGAVVLKDTVRKVTLCSPAAQRSITVAFPRMPYVGFWQLPNSDAPYVCIEPWCSLPAAHGKPTVFEEQADLLTLVPGKTYANTWSITIM